MKSEVGKAILGFVVAGLGYAALLFAAGLGIKVSVLIFKAGWNLL